MKINSLYISAFGGIKNLKLDFSDGFNVIYGDNENGKTTVMSFIKMMFYGNERGSSQIAKNIRKRYTPWDGSAMAGSIDFEHSGKRYRLEREFRSSNSTDKVTLCDLDFGTRRTVAPDVGNEFFGLSGGAFERSVFIGQFGFPESDSVSEGEINSRLSNIALSGDENISFETVNERISKAKLSLMSKSGKAGEYDKNLKTASELKARLEKSISANDAIAQKRAFIESLEAKAQQLIKKGEALKVKLNAEQDIKNAQKLKLLLELKGDLERLNETLKLNDGTIADEMYLRKLKFCISKAESADSKVQAKLSEINTLKKSIEAGLNPPENATEQNATALEGEISAANTRSAECKKRVIALETELEALRRTNIKGVGAEIALLIIGVLLAISAAGVMAFISITALVPIAIFVAGAACIAAYIVALAKKRKAAERLNRKIELNDRKINELKAELLNITEAITFKQVRLEAIRAALNSSAAVIEKQQEMLKTELSELEILNEESRKETGILLELYGKYKAAQSISDINDGLEEISRQAEAVRDIKQQINFILGDLGGISYETAERKLAEIGAADSHEITDFDALKEEYEGITAELSAIREQMAAISAEIKATSNTLENPELLRRQLGELAETLHSQKEFCAVCDIVAEALLESYAEVRRSYGSVLEKKATEIFAALTGGKYGGMSISKSFEINVEEAENFGSRELGFLSSGTADQAYLSLRLAVAQLICDGEPLPLMLDDALAQYDDARAATALEFLKEYSENAQIIMFTCHNSICNAAENCGAMLNKL